MYHILSIAPNIRITYIHAGARIHMQKENYYKQRIDIGCTTRLFVYGTRRFFMGNRHIHDGGT